MMNQAVLTEKPADPEELEASRIALQGSALERAALAARSLRALVRNPEDTRQVFYLGLVANGASFPRFLARFIVESDGLMLFKERPSIDSKHVDYAALRALPEATLGGAYVRFLDANGLDPDVFGAPPGLPEAVTYVAQRMRQVHDAWHVLTGYGSDVRGEVLLQAFTYGQTDMPSSALIALAGTAKNLRYEPQLPGELLRAWKRGQRAAFLPSLHLEAHWHRPLVTLRHEWKLDDADVPESTPRWYS